MMNYSEYMVVEKWKNETTEEIVKIKNAAKKSILLNTKWFAFLFFMIIFTSPTFGLMIGYFTLGFNCFVIAFVIYGPIWFFYLKPKYIREDILAEAKDRIEEMDIVLKYR